MQDDKELPVFIEKCKNMTSTEIQIGTVKNIEFKGNRLVGKLTIDDSDEGKRIKELLNRGSTVCIDPCHGDELNE